MTGIPEAEGRERVLILSNESEIFLFDPDGGRGKRYSDLDDEGLSVVMAAEDMFGGRLTEVKNLKERLSSFMDVDMSLITWGKGLIDGRERISPYAGSITSMAEMRAAEERFRIIDEVRAKTAGYRTTIVLLPRYVMSFLLEGGAFTETRGMIAVTTLDPSAFADGTMVLTRRGARIGRSNAASIIDALRYRQ